MSTLPYAIGIYEKALPAQLSWQERFRLVKAAGYDFLELSIDESEWRISRLDWKPAERRSFQDQQLQSGVEVLSICLSAQRLFPFGSQDPQIRSRSLEILRKAIDFAAETGIKTILVPGYDVFYEQSNPGTEERFFAGLQQAAGLASGAKVMLALENTDKYVTSIRQAKQIVDRLDSPWFQLYGDIGNLAALGYDLMDELDAGADQLAGIHIKDALPGVMREVPLGEGIVPFGDLFRKLHSLGFQGPLMLELWEDPGQDPLERIRNARQWIQDRYQRSVEMISKEKDQP